MNKFDQLVKDLDSGELSLSHVRQAIKAHVRNSEVIPEEVKGLLCGGESHGLIGKCFTLMTETMGALELAVRRARQAEESMKL